LVLAQVFKRDFALGGEIVGIAAVAHKGPDSFNCFVFRSGRIQDRYVGVRKFPSSEEGFIGRPGFDSISQQSVSTSNLQLRECSQWVIEAQSRVIEKLLELRLCFMCTIYG
jgi:hypothetical protein